jgi:hypothetical protein
MSNLEFQMSSNNELIFKHLLLKFEIENLKYHFIGRIARKSRAKKYYLTRKKKPSLY